MSYVLLFAAALLLRDDPAPAPKVLQPMDVFELEFAADPQISPDGRVIVYVRNSMDRLKDQVTAALWRMNQDGSDHRPFANSDERAGSPRWSPDGTRLAYVSGSSGSAQIHVRWLDDGQVARVTHVDEAPGSLCWSPDGRFLAFTSLVKKEASDWLDLPAPPAGAEWAPPPHLIEETVYRADGDGFVTPGHRQVFVVPAEGGTPRPLTADEHGYADLVWSPDGLRIYATSNRHDDADLRANDTEIVAIDVADGAIEVLTNRDGPDASPTVSPDGATIAYLGYDDRYQGYQVTRLYLMQRDGRAVRCLTGTFDRSVAQPTFAADGAGVFVQYTDHGNTRVGLVSLTTDGDGASAEVTELASGLGGTSLGRPYGGGSYSVASDGTFAYTTTTFHRPADVAVGRSGAPTRTVTDLNQDLLGQRTLGRVEEMRCASSCDQREIQGWIVYPPDFDAAQRWPLILEIHGGPFADYGERFAAELQLYAARGYVVLYTNPRGSTSYGEEFGNLIHHRYPGDDYHDLMSAVDAVLARGFIDPAQLFVTGGSGGGVLSAWIVGSTDRFCAAVVCKPVIDWTSFVLTADEYPFFMRYWFAAPPWEQPMQYWERSPLSRVGNVHTPTLLLTGEADHRTPISESEQFYQALKLRGVETAMIRIPEASHAITARPSNLARKAACVLSWFERYRQSD